LLGVRRMFVGLGALLLLAAALAILADRRRARSVATALLLLFVALVASALQFGAAPLPAGVVHLEDTPYGEIRVLDREDGRYLLLDGGVHTIVGFGRGESLHRYVPVMESAARLFERPGRMLLIGLGGGVLAKTYARSGWEVEAVEIDAAVVDVARAHFDLAPQMATIHATDGRLFLRSTARLSWYEDEDGLFYGGTLRLYQRLPGERLLTYEWNSSLETEPVDRVKESRLRLRYAQRFLRDWILLELAPQVAWRDDDDFDPAYGLQLRLELMFGAEQPVPDLAR